MSLDVRPDATLDDLYRAGGKAELVAGRIIHLMPTGFRPGVVGGRIFRSLDDFAKATRHGVALPDNVGFTVPELSSGRESFSPDAALFIGSLPTDEMDFIEGAPILAVEVRSKNDYLGSAEKEQAAKRADYFEAGTRVVWDVDVKARVVRSFLADSPDRPIVFSVGQVANAEPAAPGWSMAVDEIFA